MGLTASQVKAALAKAKSSLYDVVLIDTAGRLAIDEELMDELEEVREAAQPSEIFYVADSMTGQDAVRTAQGFKRQDRHRRRNTQQI